MIDDFISEYEELILEVYSVVNPEEYHSDFMLEDIDDIESFIYDYMQNEYENWRLKNEKGMQI